MWIVGRANTNGIKAEEGDDDSLLSGGGCKDLDEYNLKVPWWTLAESYIT